MSAQHLTPGRLSLYALPAMPLAVVVFPSQAILPGFYAQHTSIPLATIGAILVAARAFDGIVDPLIGFMSDSTRSRWGARKPWLIVGALLLALSVIQRSEEHTSELQSLMRISYAVFCLKKKINK